MSSLLPSLLISIYDSNVNFKTQLFSLSFSTVNYLIENADSKVLKKLQKTCKYFYLKRQIFVTSYFSICLLTKGSSFLKPQDLAFVKSKLWLAGTLSLYDAFSVPQLLTKIYKCELSSLLILDKVHLTFSDLKFLTNSGTIERLFLKCTVYESENKIIPFHQILALVPKANSIELYSVNVEQKAMEEFLKMERKVKLRNFTLWGINGMLDSNLFLEFSRKHFTTFTNLILKFETAAMNQEFRSAVDPQIRSILSEFSSSIFFRYLGFQ